MSNDRIQHEDDISGITLEQLVEKAKSGNEEALTAVLEHSEINRILDAVSAWGEHKFKQDRAEIRDVLIFKLIKNFEAIHNPRRLNSWLFSVARNYCISELRRSKGERAYVDEINHIIDGNKKHGGHLMQQSTSVETPEQELLNKEREILFEKQVRKATESFPQEIVELWKKGKTPKEIAKEIGISVATIYRTITEIQNAVMKESLSEVDAIRSRMQDSQAEIERQKKLTREILARLRVA